MCESERESERERDREKERDCFANRQPPVLRSTSLRDCTGRSLLNFLSLKYIVPVLSTLIYIIIILLTSPLLHLIPVNYKRKSERIEEKF